MNAGRMVKRTTGTHRAYNPVSTPIHDILSITGVEAARWWRHTQGMYRVANAIQDAINERRARLDASTGTW